MLAHGGVLSLSTRGPEISRRAPPALGDCGRKTGRRSRRGVEYIPPFELDSSPTMAPPMATPIGYREQVNEGRAGQGGRRVDPTMVTRRRPRPSRASVSAVRDGQGFTNAVLVILVLTILLG